jgi:hypothetical protein
MSPGLHCSTHCDQSVNPKNVSDIAPGVILSNSSHLYRMSKHYFYVRRKYPKRLTVVKKQTSETFCHCLKPMSLSNIVPPNILKHIHIAVFNRICHEYHIENRNMHIRRTRNKGLLGRSSIRLLSFYLDITSPFLSRLPFTSHVRLGNMIFYTYKIRTIRCISY